MKSVIEVMFKLKSYLIGITLIFAFGIALVLFSEKYVISSIQNATGRVTKITKLDIAWSSNPVFKAESLSLGGYAPDGSDGHYVLARGIEGKINLFSLFDERLKVLNLDVSELVLDSHFSLLSTGDDQPQLEPFLSTPLPLMGSVAIEQFSVLSHGSDGVISSPLSRHRVSLRPVSTATKSGHQFESVGNLEGSNELAISALLDIGQFTVNFEQASFVYNRQHSLVDGEIFLSDIIPKVVLSVQAEAWTTNPVEEEKNSLNTSNRNSGSARLFSDELLSLDWLREVDMVVESRIDRLVLGDAIFSNSGFDAVLHDGVLTAKLSSSGEYGGTLFAEGKVDYNSGRRAKVTVAGWLKEFPSHRLDFASKLGLLRDGELNTQFELSAIGRSPIEMAANSEGYLRSIVGKGQLRDRWIDNLGGDMAKALKHWIKDDAQKSNNKLNCLAINLEFDQGLVKIDKNILFSTPAATIVGIGEINLASEKIALRVEPMARTGTGLNASSYINVVQVGGALTSPKLVFNGVGALKAGTSVWLATATGGISLLAEGLLKRRMRRDYNCEDVILREFFPPLD